MPLQGGLSIERMCELARVSRANFYRSLKEQEPAEEEAEARSTIQLDPVGATASTVKFRVIRKPHRAQTIMR